MSRVRIGYIRRAFFSLARAESKRCTARADRARAQGLLALLRKNAGKEGEHARSWWFR
jgi:hypothetical protein